MGKKEKKVRIDGFRMPQAILERFHFLRNQAQKDKWFHKRPPASAYATYITLLKQLALEKTNGEY